MKRRIIFIASFLFICLNIILITFNEGKVEHTAYIPHWVNAEEKDMYETVETEGVIDYTRDEHIYFDERNGMFLEFYVDEGERVFSGDVLYAYEIEHYEETRTQLEHERDQLEEEIRSLERGLSDIESQLGKQSTFDIHLTELDETIKIKGDDSLQVERAIIEMESKLAIKEAQLTSVLKQYDDLRKQDQTIYVESPISGKVVNISHDLGNPIITIASKNLHITGELSESERMKVDSNMPVDIELVEESDLSPIEGFVTYVSDEPIEVKLKRESKYPFHVAFNESDFLHDDERDEDDNSDAHEGEDDTSERDEQDDNEKEDELFDEEHEFPNGEEEKKNHHLIEKDNRFERAFNEETSDQVDDDLFHEEKTSIKPLQGYHVNLNITTAKSLDATTIATKSILFEEEMFEDETKEEEKNHETDEFDSHVNDNERDVNENEEEITREAGENFPYVWKMAHNGRLIKQPVKRGIEMDNDIEIIDGVNKTDRIALNTRNNLKDGAVFITPFRPGKSDWKTIFKDGSRKRSIFIGLISR